jgi:sulfate transport system ATP-binding protein
VTHDQEEALEVADRVAIMNHGRIEQVGTPLAVYDNPANAFVYQFIGDVNLFHERTAASKPAATVAYVRPYELDLSRHKAGASDALVATVRYIGAAGPVVRLELQREDTGNSLDAEISRERFRELGLNVGDKVDVIARNLRVFAEELGSQGAGI